MSALDVVYKVRAAGGSIRAVGDSIELEAPAPLPDDLVQEIRAHKPEILRLLNRVVLFAPRRTTVHAGYTAEGAEIRRIVDYSRSQMREDGMACCDWCLRCKRNGGSCRRADLGDKPHRCAEFSPTSGDAA